MDVKTLCLGALTLGEASGYEIKKQFEQGPFSYFYDAGFGSIYPALGSLLADGLVSCTEAPRSGRRAKKIYTITEQGRAAFRAALHERPARDRIRSEHLVRFFFAELLDEDHLRAVFEEYRDHFRRSAEHVRGLDSTGIPPGRMFARGFGCAFFEAAARYMDENRHLLFGRESEGGAADDREPRRGTGQ